VDPAAQAEADLQTELDAEYAQAEADLQTELAEE